ncbi:MAG: ABC transporter ATP-binding protein [Burkholderiales bacterium]|jgi:iron complex transport system ATP-binding protein|nr:ABC transporter ATP-binding protein [Burkholderiales bacterium]
MAGTDSNSPVLIALKDVCLFRGAHTLFNGLNLEVRAGEIWSVLGENGVGKSSLLAVMSNYLPPDAGQVDLAGKSLLRISAQSRARTLAWLPQHETESLSVTVVERVLLGRHPYASSLFRDESNDIHLAEDALADVGLAGYENRIVRQLSGGEKRRVGLAACLAQQASLYLLDEPLSALDLRHQRVVLNRMNLLAQKGAGVVWITHDPNQALMCSTHVLLMLGDGVCIAGPVGEVLHASNLSQAYRCEVREISLDGTRFFFIPPHTRTEAADLGNSQGSLPFFPDVP